MQPSHQHYIPESRLRIVTRILHDRCFYCSNPTEHADHIISIKLGGESKPGNMIGACASCNCHKNSRELYDHIRDSALLAAHAALPFFLIIEELLFLADSNRAQNEFSSLEECIYMNINAFTLIFSLPGFFSVALSGGLSRRQLAFFKNVSAHIASTPLLGAKYRKINPGLIVSGSYAHAVLVRAALLRDQRNGA